MSADDVAGSPSSDDVAGVEGLEPPSEHPEWLTLDEGEEIEWVGQPATASMLPSFVWGIVLLPVLGLGLLVVASTYVSVKNTDYVVTNTTLYHKRGVLSTNIESVGLDRIQNTEYSQSLSGRQLGYGTIEISTAGSSGSDVTFRAIEEPGPVRDLVNELTRMATGAGGTGGRPSAEGGNAPPARAGGGVDQELLEELHAELRAVNDSMRNVERLLREEREGSGEVSKTGGSASASETSATSGSGTSTGETGSASDFVSPSQGPSDGSRGGSSDRSTNGADDDAPPTPFGGGGEE